MSSLEDVFDIVSCMTTLNTAALLALTARRQNASVIGSDGTAAASQEDASVLVSNLANPSPIFIHGVEILTTGLLVMDQYFHPIRLCDRGSCTTTYCYWPHTRLTPDTAQPPPLLLLLPPASVVRAHLRLPVFSAGWACAGQTQTTQQQTMMLKMMVTQAHV